MKLPQISFLKLIKNLSLLCFVFYMNNAHTAEMQVDLKKTRSAFVDQFNDHLLETDNKKIFLDEIDKKYNSDQRSIFITFTHDKPLLRYTLLDCAGCIIYPMLIAGCMENFIIKQGCKKIINEDIVLENALKERFNADLPYINADLKCINDDLSKKYPSLPHNFLDPLLTPRQLEDPFVYSKMDICKQAAPHFFTFPSAYVTLYCFAQNKDKFKKRVCNHFGGKYFWLPLFTILNGACGSAISIISYAIVHKGLSYACSIFENQFITNATVFIAHFLYAARSRKVDSQREQVKNIRLNQSATVNHIIEIINNPEICIRSIEFSTSRFG